MRRTVCYVSVQIMCETVFQKEKEQTVLGNYYEDASKCSLAVPNHYDIVQV